MSKYLSRSAENEITTALLGLLEKPDDWTEDSYCMKLRPEKFIKPPPAVPDNPLFLLTASMSHDLWLMRNNIELWTSSGFTFLRLYQPEKVNFRFLNRWRLWQAIKRVRRHLQDSQAAEQVKRLKETFSKIEGQPASVVDEKSVEWPEYVNGDWMK